MPPLHMDLDHYDFIITVRHGRRMQIHMVGQNNTLVEVSLSGLIAFSIVRDLVAQTGYEAKVERLTKVDSCAK